MQNNSSTNLCIPSIDITIKKSLIFEKIKQLNWGFIANIIEIPILKDAGRKRIVVFLKWNNNEMSQYYKQLLDNGETIKLVYDRMLPWYWRIHKQHRKE